MLLKHPFVNKDKQKNQHKNPPNKKKKHQPKSTNKLPTKKAPHTTNHYIFTVILTILINLLNRKLKVAQVKRSECQ